MVIIEVDRDFGNWNELLGEHRWAEVFKKCDEHEKERVSQIFWCTFNTGRQVQKYGANNLLCSPMCQLTVWEGWKRVFVEDRWFTKWRVPNAYVGLL
jgi:hypothetical protein